MSFRQTPLHRAACLAAATLLAGIPFVAPAPALAQSPVAAVAADLQMAQEASPFRQVADSFVAHAMAGDAEASFGMLSRTLLARSGEGTIRGALEGQILPFFRSGSATGRSVTVTRTRTADGQSGFAFYMWLAQRDGAAARPFTIYAVEEAGRIVVANVVPDRRVEGRHR